MAKKTRTHTPQPIAPMLEESFSTAVENRFAEISNLLAREGRTTSDPIALALRGLRVALVRDHGVTFERVAARPALAAVPAAPAKVAQKAATTKPAATPAATATSKVRKARSIKEEQIVSLQVAGTISEAAPYGCDAEGRPLAPYGIKLDGTPKKRRGRVAAPKEASASGTSEEASEEAEVEEGVEAASSEEASEEVSEEPASGEAEVEDLDDLLEGL